MARLKARPSPGRRAADADHDALVDVLRAEFGEEPHAAVRLGVAERVRRAWAPNRSAGAGLGAT